MSRVFVKSEANKAAFWFFILSEGVLHVLGNKSCHTDYLSISDFKAFFSYVLVEL